MQGHAVSYRPGPWVALTARGAARTVVLLAEIDPAGPVLAALWEAVDRGAGADGLLGVIVREGLRSVPSFAIVEQTEGARVVVSGKARGEIAVAGADEPLVLASAEAPTWSDRWVERAQGVRLVAEAVAGDGPALPLNSGAALAAEIVVGAAVPDASSPGVAAPGPPPAATPGEKTEEPAPPSFDHLFGSTDNPPVPASEAPTQAPVGITMSPPQDEGAPAERGTGLIESLPWQLPAEVGPGSPAPPGLPAYSQAAPEPTLPPVPQAPVPEAPPPEWHTVGRSRLTPPPEPAPEQTAPPAPTVLAAVCPNRHLGPPHSGTCRVCGQPVPQQDPISVPRPVLGVLNLSTGDMVPLDRDIVFGRAPSVTDTEPSIKPHLVQLASQANDISRSHLRISLEGWHVQAVDLGSTNGTIVTLPGQRPLRLRPHDPFTIVPGTVVSLADEVFLRFEVTA